MTDNQSPTSEQNSMEPLTVVVSRRVKKGNQEAFEALSSKMTERASRFPGYLGTAMFRPASPDDPEYRIVFKFRDRESLAAWEASEERAELLEQIESLLVQPSEREVTSGIVTWFTLPGQNPVKPPPKWKMTIVSWLALYPAVTLVFVLFGDLLAQVPLLIRTLMVKRTRAFPTTTSTAACTFSPWRRTCIR